MIMDCMVAQKLKDLLAGALRVMLRSMPVIIVMVSALPLLVACYNRDSPTPDAWDLTKRQMDSISFSTNHHYSQNYNFVVKADSLCLVCQAPDELPFDSVTVYRGDYVVVADFMTMPEDSIDSVWVKVARDQITQGWIRERAMLPGVEPDNYISQFIDTFSDVHLLLFLALIVLVSAAYGQRELFNRNAMIVHFRDIDSFYPTLLALLVAGAATLYASIQMFGPESWRHFYYHPSLNPFALPLHLGVFISFVWAIVIVGIAAIDEIVRQLSIADTLLYLCGLAAVCAVDYVIFSISTLYYIGYPLFVLYVVFAVRRYHSAVRCKYICGNCGAKMPAKGVCPHCGVLNE